MLTEAMVRDAWLRAEALCACRKAAHGHQGRCNQFLIWAERGETGRGGWEARQLSDPRRPAWEILCAACYAKATGGCRWSHRSPHDDGGTQAAPSDACGGGATGDEESESRAVRNVSVVGARRP